MDRTCWMIHQTHSNERNWARRRTFHELNSLSLVRLIKSLTFGLGPTKVETRARYQGHRFEVPMESAGNRETLQVPREFSGSEASRVPNDIRHIMITSIFSSNVNFANSSLLKHNRMRNPNQMFSRCYLCKRFFRPVDGDPLFILSSLTFLHKSSRFLPMSPNPMRFFKLSLKNARSEVTSLKYETHLTYI